MGERLAGGMVGDDGGGGAGLVECPGVGAGARVARPGGVKPGGDRDNGGVQRVHRGQRRAGIDGGEAAGVAMRENSLTVAQQGLSMPADVAAHLSVFGFDRSRFLQQRVQELPRRKLAAQLVSAFAHTVERPEKLHRSRAAAGQIVSTLAELQAYLAAGARDNRPVRLTLRRFDLYGGTGMSSIERELTVDKVQFIGETSARRAEGGVAEAVEKSDSAGRRSILGQRR